MGFEITCIARSSVGHRFKILMKGIGNIPYCLSTYYVKRKVQADGCANT